MKNEKEITGGNVMPEGTKKFSKQEKSWILYDWANSVYATNIMVAVFPIYFASVCKSAGINNVQMWGYGTSIATLIVAILAPLLGAVGDYKGMKKKLFSAFLTIGVVFTLTMAIFDQWQLLLVGYIISFIGFEGSCLFYDSFLTDVTTHDRMDRVSSWGYAMGYIGGSTIPFVLSIGVLMALGMSNPLGVKIAVVLTSVWWAVFSIPILKNVKQNYFVEFPPSKLISHTFKNIGSTLKNIFKNKGIFLYMIAYFCYIDGVGTVINMSTSYGAKLGLDSVGMIIALLVTQIVAMPSAILFGKLSQKAGSINMILGAIGLYFIICGLGFYMGYNIEQAANASAEVQASAMAFSQTLFWVMAVLVGTVQGGIQALSRSYFGKLVPPNKSNEYFGFFNIFGKFATVVGPFLVAQFTVLTGRSSIGILSIMVLFLIGGMILLLGKGVLKRAEEKVMAEQLMSEPLKEEAIK
jgi:Permeases of the major facilitator superfamily